MPVDQQDQEVCQEGLVLLVLLGQLEQQELLDLKESQLALPGHLVLMVTRDHLDPSMVNKVQLAHLEKMVQLDDPDLQDHQDLQVLQDSEDHLENLDLVALLAHQAPWRNRSNWNKRSSFKYTWTSRRHWCNGAIRGRTWSTRYTRSAWRAWTTRSTRTTWGTR